MKYNDSITQANKKMAMSVELLQQWHLPATPINFAIGYAFVSDTHPKLNRAINEQLKSGKTLDEYFLDDMYQCHILGQGNFRENIITDIDDVLTVATKNTAASTQSINTFVDHLDNNIEQIQSNNVQQRLRGINQLKAATHTLKRQQSQLAKQLAAANKQSQSLKKELDDVCKKMFMDPLTGLYNRKGMSNHVEAWFKEDPKKQVAAIVINVDGFAEFNQRFGHLISNVVLAKMAQKISSYVTDSGFPVRTSGDEFFILLPDMQPSVAQEISRKIQQGIEKLRFKSSKTGISLPQMDISLAIDKMNIQENVEHFIQRARKALQNSLTHNQPDVNYHLIEQTR